MAINDKTNSDTGLQSTSQILNQSFDQVYQLIVNEGLVYNPITNQMDRMVQPGQTLPTANLNPELALGYDGVGNLITITKTINSVDYQKTLTYDGVGNLSNVSEWIQL
jgi:hypothetical protein